jgi:hypothetical protein
MIHVECPQCGYHLGSLDVKPSEAEYVKPEQEGADFIAPPRGTLDHTTPALPTVDKSTDEIEASVAKQRLSEPLTLKDRNNIRRLYDDGYSLARIRQMLGLRITLRRIQGIVGKP